MNIVSHDFFLRFELNNIMWIKFEKSCNHRIFQTHLMFFFKFIEISKLWSHQRFKYDLVHNQQNYDEYKSLLNDVDVVMITMQERWHSEFFFRVTSEISHHMNIWKLIAHIFYFSKHTEIVKDQISITFRIFREDVHQSRRSHSKRSLTISKKWNWKMRWSLFNTLYTRVCWTMRNLRQKTTKKRVRLETLDSAKFERKKKFTTTQQHTSRLISSFIHRFTFEVECYHLIYVAWTEKIIESLSFIFRSHREKASWNESKAWESYQFVNDKRNLKVIANEHLKRKRENQLSTCVNEICSLSFLFRTTIATFRWAIDFSFCFFKIFYHRFEFQFTDFSYFIIVSNFNSQTTSERSRSRNQIRSNVNHQTKSNAHTRCRLEIDDDRLICIMNHV